MNHRIWKILALVISLGLACFVAVMLLDYKRDAAAERESLAQYADPINDRLVSLLAKRDELKLEIEDIEEEITEADDKLGSVVFLFAQPAKTVSSEIAPLMDGYDYPGTIALSADYYPGVEGCLTWQEIKDLQEQGWEVCVSMSQISELDELKEIFEKGKMTFPSTVYYPDGRCEESMEEYLLDNGFETLIEYDGTTSIVEDGKLWHVCAYGSNLSDSNSTTKKYMGQSKPIVLTVGFTDNREAYSHSNLEAMLKVVNEYAAVGDTKVTTIGGAKERYSEHCKNMGAVTTSLEKDYIEKKKQLEEIEAEIRKIRE